MNDEKRKWRFETEAIKSAQNHLQNINPVSTPIYLSTTYERNGDGSYGDGLIYSRHNNPNRHILEESICQMEIGAQCFAFASGMAAISAVFQSLKPGDHVLLPDDVYYNVYLLAENILKAWGLEFSTVDMASVANIAAAIQPNTRLIWIETPSNPQLKITNIERVSQLVQTKEITIAVDNTWATPVLMNPITLGADIVIHSTTKYFGGHSDVLGGCVVLKEASEFGEKIKNIQTLSGGVPAPFDCWLISRGIQTLALRVRAQSNSAQILAEYLESHPKIEKVNYPGLISHPQYKVAASQMQHGFGGMLSAHIKGDHAHAIKVANQLELFTTATSLGGVESLVEHRKSVEGPSSSTPDNLLRISVGLEHAQDLINDWENALKTV